MHICIHTYTVRQIDLHKYIQSPENTTTTPKKKYTKKYWMEKEKHGRNVEMTMASLENCIYIKAKFPDSYL